MDNFEERVKDCYSDNFGKKEDICLFAPGRVNLIGEHIDYNGGRVMPCSLSVGTYGAAGLRSDGKIALVSADLKDSFVETSVEEIGSLEEKPEFFSGFGWAAYPLGVVRKLLSMGHKIGGFNMAVTGSLPRGSGLSSSASLEILTCAVLKKLFGLDIDGVEASKLSVEAERDCAGVNCGIMDQFVCAMGRKDGAILLDTATLEYEYKPFDLGDKVLLIMNTRKPRRLADSKYNERRSECERAIGMIGGEFEPAKKALCELTPSEFEGVKNRLSEPVVRRAKHAVYENERTYEAAEALEKGDMEKFGRLLNESHDSLKDDYEVTGKELDSIVYAARAQEGVLGARMTGAGFGGCAIALVKREKADQVISAVTRIYKNETGYDCEIFKAETHDAPFAR